ncbi:hypothetical protein SZ25_00385 [Candidatus Arcanobacter lacustris]|uniref:Uncharacterized protein n=1 Tax=Candidatus Arcanibacter lacustris TaxID=1607817 RepID=A0A0F5MNW4_9RICK|nr:hypothetical protein SZ25_00385 [Candidatus Arcanobacter lacustris]
MKGNDTANRKGALEFQQDYQMQILAEKCNDLTTKLILMRENLCTGLKISEAYQAPELIKFSNNGNGLMFSNIERSDSDFLKGAAIASVAGNLSIHEARQNANLIKIQESVNKAIQLDENIQKIIKSNSRNDVIKDIDKKIKDSQASFSTGFGNFFNTIGNAVSMINVLNSKSPDMVAQGLQSSSIAKMNSSISTLMTKVEAAQNAIDTNFINKTTDYLDNRHTKETIQEPLTKLQEIIKFCPNVLEQDTNQRNIFDIAMHKINDGSTTQNHVRTEEKLKQILTDIGPNNSKKLLNKPNVQKERPLNNVLKLTDKNIRQDLLSTLLEQGASVAPPGKENNQTCFKPTLMHQAAKIGSNEMHLILCAGGNPNVVYVDLKDYNFVSRNAFYMGAKIYEKLGGEVYGDTPLHIAVKEAIKSSTNEEKFNENIKTVIELMQHKDIKTDIKDRGGITVSALVAELEGDKFNLLKDIVAKKISTFSAESPLETTAAKKESALNSTSPPQQKRTNKIFIDPSTSIKERRDTLKKALKITSKIIGDKKTPIKTRLSSPQTTKAAQRGLGK